VVTLALAACSAPGPSPAVRGDAGDAGSEADAAAYRPDPVTLGLQLPAAVPVLWIEIGGASIQEDVEVPGRLRVIEDPGADHAAVAQRPAALSASIGFQGRGGFTFTLPKKGFAFEVQDGAGQARGLGVLGLPKGSDFALYACYTDKTCMRNAVVYALAQQLGRWSPRTRFVELYLDGKYQGLYMLWERVRRDRHRLTLVKPAPNASAGDVSGGYILRHEGPGKGNVVVGGMTIAQDFVTAPAPGGVVYTFHDPRPEELTDEQRALVVDHFQRFEEAMKTSADAHRRWVDVPTWVDHAIVEELTNNWDGYVHSVYMIKQPQAAGGLIEMGPPWDFDLAFANGNVTGYHCRTDSWTYRAERPYPDNVPAYWRRLFADASFQSVFKCRWRALRRSGGPLDTAEVFARIDRWVAFTAAARARDQQRWPTLGKMIFPNCQSRPTYTEEITALKDWISARVAWLDAQTEALPGACDRVDAGAP
jgi:hypothetical protein